MNEVDQPMRACLHESADQEMIDFPPYAPVQFLSSSKMPVQRHSPGSAARHRSQRNIDGRLLDDQLHRLPPASPGDYQPREGWALRHGSGYRFAFQHTLARRDRHHVYQPSPAAPRLAATAAGRGQHLVLTAWLPAAAARRWMPEMTLFSLMRQLNGCSSGNRCRRRDITQRRQPDRVQAVRK